MKVKELYRQVQLQSNAKLLSTFEPGTGLNDFWAEYRANSTDLDRQFARMYADFTYYNPLGEEGLTDWLIDIRSFLLKNAKRYSELWRIQVLEDADLPLTYNYDLKETYHESHADQGAVTTGQRTDVNNNQIGSQNNTAVNKSTAFNSSDENITDASTSGSGSRQDINQFTKGQETDTNRNQGTNDHTLTRVGNIGTQTSSDILLKFVDAIPVFDFYNKVFADICEELLQIGGKDDTI